MTQIPELASVGVIADTSSATSRYSAGKIKELAAGHGITVHEAGVAAVTDLRLAAERLVEKEVGALVLPVDFLTTFGLPILTGVANENGIPIFHPSTGSVALGATIGIGFALYYDQGVNVGVALANYLTGDLDIASTAISITEGTGLGINLDSAAEQNIEINSALLEESDLVFADGRFAHASDWYLEARSRRGVIIPLDERQAMDRAWLATLQCTPEMIAEQQAAPRRPRIGGESTSLRLVRYWKSNESGAHFLPSACRLQGR